MNKTYRLIWNETTNTWAVVSELAKARGKRASGAVILFPAVDTPKTAAKVYSYWSLS